MAKVTFTSHLRRYISCPPQEVSATTVAQALATVFADNHQLEDYVLDEQGRLRKHVSIFVDNVMIQDRLKLSDAVQPNSQIYVLQALSGG